jgi:hypothetical protein
VVIWEPKRGAGGGHQLVMDRDAADRLHWRLSKERPFDLVRVESAEAHAAAAVMEGQRPTAWGLGSTVRASAASLVGENPSARASSD